MRSPTTRAIASALAAAAALAAITVPAATAAKPEPFAVSCSDPSATVTGAPKATQSLSYDAWAHRHWDPALWHDSDYSWHIGTFTVPGANVTFFPPYATLVLRVRALGRNGRVLATAETFCDPAISWHD